MKEENNTKYNEKQKNCFSKLKRQQSECHKEMQKPYLEIKDRRS
jgi:hypothetical protein